MKKQEQIYESPVFDLIEMEDADIVCLSDGGTGDGQEIILP